MEAYAFLTKRIDVKIPLIFVLPLPQDSFHLKAKVGILTMVLRSYKFWFATKSNNLPIAHSAGTLPFSYFFEHVSLLLSHPRAFTLIYFSQ